MDINDYRLEIDEIDKEIIDALARRMKVSEKIGKYKADNNMRVLDLSREQKKLKEIANLAPEELKDYAKILYSTIFQISKDYQKKKIGAEGLLSKRIIKSIDETPRLFPEKSMVACQGVEGAYSQLACDKLFKDASIVYTKGFEGVFAAVSSGLCQYGVLPLENSTAGSVTQIYDLMMREDFFIVRSTRLKIDHNLMVKPGVKKENIREIFSHEQAIAQSQEFLSQLDNVKVTVCENTAFAAKMIAESKRDDVAALSSYSCASLYGLEILERSVQDKGNNYTKFICISKKLEIYPAANKTSLMMVIDHRPGALYNILARFYVLGINLIKLESRPIPDRDFEFMFYFDIESQIYSEEFTNLISQLEDMSQEIKYLGSYLEIV